MRELFPIYAKRFTSLAANYKSLSQKWTNTSTCHQLLSVVNTTGYQRLPIDVEPKGEPRCRLTKRVGSTDGLGMIAIGRNAQANLPGEFVLNVELDKQQNIYTTFRTILSEPEFTMLSNILRRMIRDAAT